MITLHVEKLGKAVVLTYDDQSLLIEGDLDTKKRGKNVCVNMCILEFHFYFF